MHTTVPDDSTEELRARPSQLNFATCSALFVGIGLFLVLYEWLHGHFGQPDAPYWAAWQIARGVVLLALGAILLRTASRRARGQGHLGMGWFMYGWLAVLGVILLHHGTVSFGAAYARSRFDEFEVEEFGIAPGASFAEVLERAVAAGFSIDPADRSRVRPTLVAERESSRRFLHVRFHVKDSFTFIFYEENRLDRVTRFRISSPWDWSGGGFVDWAAVDGTWAREAR